VDQGRKEGKKEKHFLHSLTCQPDINTALWYQYRNGRRLNLACTENKIKEKRERIYENKKKNILQMSLS
jgi:hypothetical protein